MAEFVEVTKTIEVPKGAGIEGFIRILRQVLKLPRVTDVHISANGTVKAKHWVQEEAIDVPLNIDFVDLCPYTVIRNHSVVDMGYADDTNALHHMFRMCNKAREEQLHCVAFVTGAMSKLEQWIAQTCGEPSYDYIMGLPVYRDRFIDDDALILCLAYAEDSEMKDVIKSYRITIPGGNANVPNEKTG